MWCGTLLYHPQSPQGNGEVERFNCTLLGMLRTLPETQKSCWADNLNHLVHAYNCTRHESTGYSPFFLLFGRHPRLPVDLMFGIEGQTNHENHSQYVEKWRKAMTEAYKLAGKKSKEVGTRAKKGMITLYEAQYCSLVIEFVYVI